VLNDLAEHGVLAGLTGPRGDVLKIRPPLIWQTRHVALLVARLDAVLAQQSR
jgi:4-aminobutyrate aminotransferase-like enzyme